MALRRTQLGVICHLAEKVFRREEPSETNFRLFLMAVPVSALLAFSCFRVGTPHNLNPIALSLSWHHQSLSLSRCLVSPLAKGSSNHVFPFQATSGACASVSSVFQCFPLLLPPSCCQYTHTFLSKTHLNNQHHIAIEAILYFHHVQSNAGTSYRRIWSLVHPIA
jgi:hypothetical protein